MRLRSRVQWIYCRLRFVLNSWPIRFWRRPVRPAVPVGAYAIMAADFVVSLLTVVQRRFASRRLVSDFRRLDHRLTKWPLLYWLDLQRFVVCVLVQDHRSLRHIRPVFQTDIIILLGRRLLIRRRQRRVLLAALWRELSNLVLAHLRAAEGRPFELHWWFVIFVWNCRFHFWILDYLGIVLCVCLWDGLFRAVYSVYDWIMFRNDICICILNLIWQLQRALLIRNGRVPLLLLDLWLQSRVRELRLLIRRIQHVESFWVLLHAFSWMLFFEALRNLDFFEYLGRMLWSLALW